ncbi:tryptophan 2,3-dioxygenase [Phyllobacterium sp. 22229]|uniref:Tryptophan 2,3-dioxygenase n=1 Tax=Phyllobacterium myrsinacearum TaxID=28101 RepID=A0A2S9JPP1_9HYPH|nr:tryptophan 2,3-dioxygenase [Phyllobacterium myrsinacearum]PRD55151.1 tryptophan 2,3-dioxygenase [Phyllobacterium myrsinacearum]PWV90279.1 tryptophan 2,3-dioxygenase [Phyllobacterium myrsinacearum]RZS79681.1 tryptophan 2,3-dioxygenase [Phyllobacterium myrsinacearum]RZV05526.1 tryptophan 2,3-dioxygenase [Phyllobacterium myrsinacearum]
MSRTPYNPETEGAQMSFDGRMSYGDYLRLDKILTAQAPLSHAHDEMLFIVQHQASEIWMRLVIHELMSVCEHIAKDDLAPSFKMLSRVSRILDQLNSAWDVLRTMTPSEYTTFREALGMSSGFQSFQYRAIEFLAGNKNAAMMRPHVHRPEIHAWLEGILRAPSIYDQSIRLLARKGFAIDAAVLERDCALPYEANDSVRDAWLVVYRAPEAHWPLYELAEKLVDFEDYFRRWRFNHVTTVERIIGFKTGTGGTSGVNYLRKMLDVVLFPELWSMRTEL